MSNDEFDDNRSVDQADLPPVFNSWEQMYGFVLLFHVFIIFLFWWFTKSYS